MIKLAKFEDLYFNISSLILRWEPSEKKNIIKMFCSVYVGGVYEVQSWTAVHCEDVDCEMCLNREINVCYHGDG